MSLLFNLVRIRVVGSAFLMSSTNEKKKKKKKKKKTKKKEEEEETKKNTPNTKKKGDGLRGGCLLDAIDVQLRAAAHAHRASTCI